MCVQIILVLCPGPLQSFIPILGALWPVCLTLNNQCPLLWEPLYPQEPRDLILLEYALKKAEEYRIVKVRICHFESETILWQAYFPGFPC